MAPIGSDLSPMALPMADLWETDVRSGHKTRNTQQSANRWQQLVDQFRLTSELKQWIVIVIASLSWGILLAFLFRGHTFFWDEWNVLRDTISNPVGSIWIENGGNFFPLSRLVFSGEVVLFSAWYPGYIFTTACLFGLISAITYFRVLQPRTPLEHALAIILVSGYLLSTGVLFASTMGFMNLWPLSVLFAVLAGNQMARAPTDSKALITSFLLMSLSWLSHGTAILSTTCIAIAIALVTALRGSRRLSRPRKWGLLAALPLAIIAGFVAAQLATFSAPQGTQSTSVLSNLRDPSLFVIESAAGYAAALVSGFTVFPLFHFGIFTTLFLFLVVANWAALVVAGIGVLLASTSKPRSAGFVLLGLLAMSTLFLALVRTPLILRYEVLWIPIVLVLVWHFITSHRNAVTATLMTLVVVLVGAGSLIGGAIKITSISDIERERSVVNVDLLWHPSTCLPEATMHREEISPSLSPTEICEVVRRVKN